ncbi:MAG: rhodanese-like domain-containing protein [Oscillibacter sp.]|nr:rhodanese-like domain-containing protein [Oscillibacter sp.]
MKQFFLLAAVICFGVAAIRFYTSKMSRNGSAPSVLPPEETPLSPEELQARLEGGALLLDVRAQEDFDRGHREGAVCLPLEDIQEDLPLPFAQDTEVFLCSHSGQRSAQAAERLRAMGYSRVVDLGGTAEKENG